MASASLAGNQFHGSDDEFKEVIEEMADQYKTAACTYEPQHNNDKVHWQYIIPGTGKIVWYNTGALVFQGTRFADIKNAWHDAAGRVHAGLNVAGNIHDQPAMQSNAATPTTIGVPHGTRANEIRARLLMLPGYAYVGHHLEQARSEYIFDVTINNPVPAGLNQLELTWYYNARANRLVARVVGFRMFSAAARATAIQAFYDAYNAAHPDHALVMVDDDDDDGAPAAPPAPVAAAAAAVVAPAVAPAPAAAAAPGAAPPVPKHQIKTEDEPMQ